MCSHTVAVAELCGKLPEFIACFKKTKKAPSLTQFAEATMPKGKGRKGSQCPRKHKISALTTAVLENPSISQCPSFSAPNQQVSTPVSDPSCSPSTSGLPPASMSQTNYLQLPSVTQHLHVTSTPSHLYPHPQPPWSYGYHHGYMSPPSPYPIPLQQGTSSMPPCPFVLSKIVGNISVCAGCRNKYPKQPTPPDDRCIRHKEWRTSGSTSGSSFVAGHFPQGEIGERISNS